MRASDLHSTAGWESTWIYITLFFFCSGPFAEKTQLGDCKKPMKPDTWCSNPAVGVTGRWISAYNPHEKIGKTGKDPNFWENPPRSSPFQAPRCPRTAMTSSPLACLVIRSPSSPSAGIRSRGGISKSSKVVLFWFMYRRLCGSVGFGLVEFLGSELSPPNGCAASYVMCPLLLEKSDLFI